MQLKHFEAYVQEIVNVNIIFIWPVSVFPDLDQHFECGSRSNNITICGSGSATLDRCTVICLDIIFRAKTKGTLPVPTKRRLNQTQINFGKFVDRKVPTYLRYIMYRYLCTVPLPLQIATYQEPEPVPTYFTKCKFYMYGTTYQQGTEGKGLVWYGTEGTVPYL